jgi:hypothetical protein
MQCLINLAEVAQRQGDDRQGLLLLAAIEGLGQTIDVALLPPHLASYTRLVESARARLDPREFGATWSLGRSASAVEVLTGSVR